MLRRTQTDRQYSAVLIDHITPVTVRTVNSAQYSGHTGLQADETAEYAMYCSLQGFAALQRLDLHDALQVSVG